jgi:hypothetical protein
MPPSVYDPDSRIHRLVYGHLGQLEKDGTICPGAGDEVFSLVFSPDREGRAPALPPGRALRLVYERIGADPDRYLGAGRPDAGSGLDVLQRLRAQGHLARGAEDEVQRTLVGVGRMAAAAAERIVALTEEDGKGHLKAEKPGPDVYQQRARAVIDMLAEHVAPHVSLDDLAAGRFKDLGRMPAQQALHVLAGRLRNPMVARDVCRDGVPASVTGYEISMLAARLTADNPYRAEVADRLGRQL